VHSPLQTHTLADDLALGQMQQRRVQGERLAFHAAWSPDWPYARRLRRIRAAIRVAGIIHRVHADEDVLRLQHLGHASASDSMMVLRQERR